jgi:histidine triad (HIT) family protein
VSCIFCRVIAGEFDTPFVHVDDEVVAFHDRDPKAPVHVLVVPRRHIASLVETNDGDTELLGRLQRVAIEVAHRLGHAGRGFRLVFNAGDDAGQSVAHIHLHLLAGRQLSWPPG